MIRRMSLWSPTARRFFKRRTRLKATYTACQRTGAVRRRGNNQWNMSPESVVAPCRTCKVLGRTATPGSLGFWPVAASCPTAGGPGQDRTAWSKQRRQALQLRHLVGQPQRY